MISFTSLNVQTESTRHLQAYPTSTQSPLDELDCDPKLNKSSQSCEAVLTPSVRIWNADGKLSANDLRTTHSHDEGISDMTDERRIIRQVRKVPVVWRNV